MGGLESVITGLMDEFKDFFKRWKYSREVFTSFVLFTSFSMALINVTRVSRKIIPIIYKMSKTKVHIFERAKGKLIHQKIMRIGKCTMEMGEILEQTCPFHKQPIKGV